MTIKMVRKSREWLQNKFFYIAWLFLHIAYQLQLEVRNYLRFNLSYLTSRLWSCAPVHSQDGELSKFVESTVSLTKAPKHLAISVIPHSQESVLSMLLRKTWLRKLSQVSSKKKEDSNQIPVAGDKASLQALARVIAWASAANIPVISLYDYHGVLKTRYRELGQYIQEEVAQDFWAVQRCRDVSHPPIVKFHNVHKSNGYTNGINGTKPHEILNIFLYSRNDGKPALVKAVQDLYVDKAALIGSGSNGNSPVPVLQQTPVEADSSPKIDEKILDSYLNRYNCWSSSIVNAKTEPDLLLILGNVKSTMGFLPWHIRLTEIHWLPELRYVGLSDFHASLIKYSCCQQRIGT